MDNGQEGYWLLVFESFGDDERPMPARVKRLLKLAKRTCGLKCIAVRDPTAEEAERIEAGLAKRDNEPGG